ncbi:MAG: flagellar biosynthetic protein FliO [Acidimicrobiales bacterium]
MTGALLAASHGAVTTAQDVSVGHVLLQMVLALVVVIGGIWGFGKIMGRRGHNRRPGGRSRSRSRSEAHGLTVLSRQAVGKGKSIAVVQAGAQCFVVGIADSGLTPLGELREVDADSDADAAGDAAGARPPLVPGPAGAAAGRRTMALAPLDLGSLDLSALASRSGVGGRRLPARAAASGDAGNGPGGLGSRVAATDRLPAVRSWIDALREATVRR